MASVSRASNIVMEPVTIRLPDDTYRTLKAEADESGRSMSEMVRHYVERLNYGSTMD